MPISGRSARRCGIRSASRRSSISDLLFLLDTHVFIRWTDEPHRLSKDQIRVLDRAVASGGRLAVSSITLIEIATLFGRGSRRSSLSAEKILGIIESADVLDILPISLRIAREVAVMGDSLKDPADRVIVATARIQGLRLVTSHQRIVESGLVPVVE
ncbi:MAG TPA: type II toxin-antitoxin system VapC family toxin [Bryobacteraceae bacterium]|nr:type II toxin-antitoxin system VapC family toxin [Bryobacteraceae bacterium]